MVTITMPPPPNTADPYMLFTPSGPNVNSEGVAVAWDNLRLFMGIVGQGANDLDTAYREGNY